MITVLIVDNEEKVKEILAKMLDKEGNINLGVIRKENIVKIINKDFFTETATLKDKLIELEDSLYNEKKGVLYKSILEIIEKPIIERALERAEGNQFKAARVLGINRNTMRVKIKKLGIDPTIYR